MADQAPSQTPVPPSSQPPPLSQTGSQEPSASSASTSGEPATSSGATALPKPDPDATDGPALDASIEQDIDLNASNDTKMTNANDAEDPTVGNPIQTATSVDAFAAAAAPSKKETSLREFLGKMDEYAPIVSFFPIFPFILMNDPSLSFHDIQFGL